MRMKWLALLAALLMVACNNTTPDSGDTTGGNSATQEKSAPGDADKDHDHADGDKDHDEADEKEGDNSFDGKKVSESEATQEVETKVAKKDELKAAQQDETKVAQQDEPKVAQQDDEEPEVLTIAEQLAAIKTQYTKANSDFRKAARGVTDSDERMKLSTEFRKSISELTSNAMTLATENMKDDAAIDAISWVASMGDPAQKTKAIDLAMENFADSPGIKDIAVSLARSAPSQKSEDLLKSLLEKSPHKEVQAAALYSMTQFYDSVMRGQEYAKKNEEYKAPDFIKEFDADSVNMEALYEKLENDFGDLSGGRTTYGEIASKALFEIRYLSIGKVAPNIEGKDLDGEEFQLTDYRGKVVVIDFWGDW